MREMGNWCEYQIRRLAGVDEICKRTNIEPKIFPEVLSSENAPRLDILRTILNALECRVSIELKTETNNAGTEISDL